MCCLDFYDFAEIGTKDRNKDIKSNDVQIYTLHFYIDDFYLFLFDTINLVNAELYKMFFIYLNLVVNIFFITCIQ